jgi:uncharacterized protein (DUF362 family)
MTSTRFPSLNILDMIYIAVSGGPASTYLSAVGNRMLAASCDPVALDWWAAQYVLVPAAREHGNRLPELMDSEATEPGTFGHWLRLTMAELQKKDLPVTNKRENITVTLVEKLPVFEFEDE